MTPAIEEFKKNKQAHLERLKTLARIPSVSFPDFDPSQVVRSAEAVKSLFVETGLDNVQLLKIGNSFPYVYGEWLKAPGAPTLLLYAHHDVQPPGDTTKWKSPPFEPTEREGRLYGRGCADDKAGIICHTAAIASYLKSQGKLPINVKVLIEGEEEVGSDNLDLFLQTYKKLLQADAVIIMDAANFDVNMPSITVGLRGIVTAEVEVKALEHSVHSGLWGGSVPDPALALCKMLAGLEDDNGVSTLKSVRDAVRPLSAAEKEKLSKLRFNDEEFRKQSSLLPGVRIPGPPGNIYEKTWFQPALSISAFEAGAGKKTGNIINASAWARIGIRTVPNLNPKDIFEELKTKLEKLCPWGLNVVVKSEGHGNWWFSSPEGPLIQAAKRSLQRAYGVEPVIMGCGGSIPFVQSLCDALGGKPALLLAVEDPYTNAHSENESLHLGDWESAVVGEILFFDEFKSLR